VHVPTAAEIAIRDGLGDSSTLPLARAAERSVRQAASEARTRLRRPQRTRLMVVANQKGGVGKTTTAVNVAAALAAGGLRILVVDLDPQGNASTALSVPHAEGTAGTYDVLTGERTLDEVTVESPHIPGLFVVPATIDLAGAEIELVSLEQRESRLREALRGSVLRSERPEERFDFVVVDCPPSLGLLTLNALAAGDELLVPIQCEYYALEGLSQLLRTIDSVREHVNPSLRLGSILLTMYDGRTRLATGVADEVRNHFGRLVLRTTIPRSVRISEAPSYGQTVLTYDPESLGAKAYRAVAVELTDREESR
jgi:chromosome partitioning protein